MPLTRSCLDNKRVRKELGQHKEDTGLEDLQFCDDVLVDSIEVDEYNPGIYDAVSPRAVQEICEKLK